MGWETERRSDVTQTLMYKVSLWEQPGFLTGSSSKADITSSDERNLDIFSFIAVVS